MKRWITLSAICTLLVLIVGLGYAGTSQGAGAATVAASQGPDPTPPPDDGGGAGQYPDIYARCYDPGRVFCCYDAHWNLIHCRCTWDAHADGYRWYPYH
jgi:hypothetical protein